MQALKENQSYFQKAEVAQDAFSDHRLIKCRYLKKYTAYVFKGKNTYILEYVEMQ